MIIFCYKIKTLQILMFQDMKKKRSKIVERNFIKQEGSSDLQSSSPSSFATVPRPSA